MGYSNSNAARVGVGTANPVTKQLEFVSCGLTRTDQLVMSDGMRDGRSRDETSVVFGTNNVAGPLVLDVRPDELNELLPYILGAPAAVEVFAVAETLTEFYCHIDKVADLYVYSGCKVNQATFRSAKNGFLQLALDILGKTETAGTAFPAISASLSAMRPYIHHQAVLTLGGVAYPFDNVEVTINNALQADVFRNSQNRTDLPEGDRIVTLAADFPFTATEKTAFKNQTIAGISTNSLVYTQSASIFCSMAFGNLKWAAETPVINGRGQEIGWRLTFQALRSGATKEIEITNSIA